MTVLAAKIEAIHDALELARIPHAFGGALALAYCTGEPRATVDIDLNVFVDPSRASKVFAALPDGVIAGEQDIAVAERDGQVRLWWDETPVDLFFAYHRFHHEAAEYARAVPFGEREIPVLDCTHLAVFKALFGRPRDWVDIEAMATAESWEPDDALRWMSELLGTESEAYRNLARVAGRTPDEHADDAYRRAFGRPRNPSNEE